MYLIFGCKFRQKRQNQKLYSLFKFCFLGHYAVLCQSGFANKTSFGQSVSTKKTQERVSCENMLCPSRHFILKSYNL